MFWPFVDVAGELNYCPLADFGAQHVCEGKDIYAKAIVAQPLTGDLPLQNASDVRGKIVVMERGACDFVTKVRHAQDAGAVAVIVANASSEDPSAAFVMDAGSQPSTAKSIEIPALMMPHSKAAVVFAQLRRSYLDRHECALTIRFLGVQAAALVLEQIELVATQRTANEREEQHTREREQLRLDATKQLRSRLSSQQQLAASPSSASSSIASRSVVSTPSSTPRCIRPPLLLHSTTRWSDRLLQQASTPFARQSKTSSSSDDSSIDETSSTESKCSSNNNNNNNSSPSCSGSSARSASAKTVAAVITATRCLRQVVHHWCPMTTALLVMDMQHYFALDVNDASFALDAHSDRYSNGRTQSVDRAYYRRIYSVVVPTIQDVLLASRAVGGVEVVYSVVESATCDGRDRSRAHQHAGIHVPRGGFGAQILARVAPTENDIVLPRTGVNVFESTNLDYTLRTLGVSHVVVLGLSALSSLRVCIQSALDRGYEVTVLREGIVLDAAIASREDPSSSSSSSESSHRRKLEAWLKGIEAIGCRVQSAAAFCRELQAFTEHDDDAFVQSIKH